MKTASTKAKATDPVFVHPAAVALVEARVGPHVLLDVLVQPVASLKWRAPGVYTNRASYAADYWVDKCNEKTWQVIESVDLSLFGHLSPILRNMIGQGRLSAQRAFEGLIHLGDESKASQGRKNFVYGGGDTGPKKRKKKRGAREKSRFEA